MKAQVVMLNIRAILAFNYTELDDDKAPETMDWEQFKLLVDEMGQEPAVIVDVIRTTGQDK